MKCSANTEYTAYRKGIGFCAHMVLLQDGEYIQLKLWFSPATSEIFGISAVWVNLWEEKHPTQLSTSPGLTAVSLT